MLQPVNHRGRILPSEYFANDRKTRELRKNPPVGAEIKSLRKARGMTILDLSNMTGLSIGYLSQIERGQSTASAKALLSVCMAFGVTIEWLLGTQQADDETLSRFVVRSSSRRCMTFAGGITDELISPNLLRQIEMLRCVFAPGSSSAQTSFPYPGEEGGIVISGKLNIFLDGKLIELATGDSFAFESKIPHRYENPGAVEAVVIMAVSPPTH
ncbi:MAG: XRE family transcriptional regulator [Pseudomonadota bacterium]